MCVWRETSQFGSVGVTVIYQPAQCSEDWPLARRVGKGRSREEVSIP